MTLHFSSETPRHHLRNAGAVATAMLTFLGGLWALSDSALAAQIYDKDGSEFSVFGRVQAAFVNDAAYQEMARDIQSSDHTLYASARLG